MRDRTIVNDADWKRILTAEQFRVTRQKGTERPYSGKYCDFDGAGVYRCVCCGNALFSSEAKFAVRSKWPAFWQPIAQANVRTAKEILHFMVRNEVLCSCCDAHLGYVFEDGRPPTGIRYFINSCALQFVGHRGRNIHSPGACVSEAGPALAR